MNIASIGGGPAGLYLGILVKRAAPAHDVVVYERNRPADTFGFGVVFSDATLDHLAAADPETHAQITAKFARWDDIEVHAGGEVLRSTGHGFCGLERKELLAILQRRAAELGVRVVFEHDVKSLADVSADVIVACDGAGSWVRDALSSEVQPQVDVRPNKFVWLGCTLPYRAFTFLFKETPHGLFRVHAYPFTSTMSTFIVECREETWHDAGLATATEDETLAILGGIFADDLGGYALVKNRSIWRNFPTVRCGKWSAGNVVLVGDAAHTAHFSIGSGTKLAMEDVIILRDELLAPQHAGDVPAALAAYEARRRPEVEALQAAAQASLEWFEGTERYMHMTPTELTYSLMTRSLRVSHASMLKRDPELARAVEHLLAERAHVTPRPPTSLPYVLGDRTARTRIAVAGTPDELVAAARAGAGIVITRPIDPEELRDPAWPQLVADVHAAGALFALTLATTPRRGDATVAASTRGFTGSAQSMHDLAIAATGSPAAVEAATTRATDGSLAAAAIRARALEIDLLVLDPVGDVVATELLPSALGVVRAGWRPGGWLAAVVHDLPRARNAVVGHAAQLVRASANVLIVHAPSDGSARLPAAPIADRLRNELGVATCVAAAEASLSDLDAAIAAGRADLVVAAQMPTAYVPAAQSNRS